MLRIIIRKVKLHLQSFLHLLLYRPNKKLNVNNLRLIDEVKVKLEWRMLEIMDTYPTLTMGEAEQVITMFYNGRHVLQQEGWFIIDGFVKEVLYTRQA